MSYDTFEYQAFFSTVQIKTFPASGVSIAEPDFS